MIQQDLRGVFVVLATPFREDESLDVEGLEHLVDWVLERKPHGLTILGIAGEVYKLTDAEREIVLQTVTRRASVPVIVGAGHPGGTRGTIAYCLAAETAGAAAVMVAPPFVAKPSADQIVEFYSDVNRRIAIPIVIQDEPSTTGILMPSTLLARIADYCPGCRYAKIEHLPTPPKISEIAALVPDARLGLFGGSGGLYFLDELRRGARGIMTGFAYPEILVRIWENELTGSHSDATGIFHQWLPLIKLEAQQTIGVALRKEILRRRGALPHATVRRPAPLLDTGTIRELDALQLTLDGNVRDSRADDQRNGG